MEVKNYQMRIPADLHQRITDAANKNGRSVHAEYLQRITASFEQEENESGGGDQGQIMRVLLEIKSMLARALKIPDEK